MNKKEKKIVDSMIFKKYKLAFLGFNPKEDWSIIVILFFILMFVFSTWFYFDKIRIENIMREGYVNNEKQELFQLEKAEKLIQEIKNIEIVDQSQEN
jgi:hypothetical protein